MIRLLAHAISLGGRTRRVPAYVVQRILYAPAAARRDRFREPVVAGYRG
jgi:hypothetical protein